jgi:acyl-CoA reductase-like NAD-dependent aldehyde dehydrogenase
MLIGGSWTQGAAAGTIPVRSPATGELLAEVPSASRSDVDAAVAAAREGQRELERLTEYERAQPLHAAPPT